MMSKDTLRLVCSEQRARLLSSPHGVKREALAKVAKPMPQAATVITGARRCGKSVLLRQLVALRHPDGDFAYFDFDDERLLGLQPSDLQQLLEVLHEAAGEPSAFFFDEVQNAPGWELFVSRLLKGGKAVYVTGSNSNMLASELGSRLTGRHIDVRLMPFSFSEFLSARGIALPSKVPLTRERAIMGKAFGEYLSVGGYPQAVLGAPPEFLRQLYEDALARDIIARKKVAKPSQLRQAGRFLLSNIARMATARSVSSGFGLSPATAMKYLRHFEEAHLLFTAQIYSRSQKVQVRNPSKVYAADWALAAANGVFSSQDAGRKLENAVACHLLRMGEHFCYYRSGGGKECDFVILKEGRPRECIQVCADPSDAATRRREGEGLLAAQRELRVKKAFILTLESESEGNARCIPAWKWMLGLHD